MSDQEQTPTPKQEPQPNPKPAAIDSYLNIDGVKGESLDGQHKDWIEIPDVSPKK